MGRLTLTEQKAIYRRARSAWKSNIGGDWKDTARLLIEREEQRREIAQAWTLLDETRRLFFDIEAHLRQAQSIQAIELGEACEHLDRLIMIASIQSGRRT
jgi:hypothetical protein